MRFAARSIFVLSCVTPLFAQPPIPDGAFIIERQMIPASARANRELVLGMEHPVKHDNGPRDSDTYTCPELTTGSGYYEGPTRISLIDTLSRRLVNTIKLEFEYGGLTSQEGGDGFILPYRIARMNGAKPGLYEVPGSLEHGEGRPKLLALKDYNGDGKALEAAFFVAEACMGLPTTLIGYRVKQDRVIEYEVDFPGGPEKWIDYLFAERPRSPGYWKYLIDYSGRMDPTAANGDGIERFEIRYDPVTERFKSLIR